MALEIIVSIYISIVISRKVESIEFRDQPGYYSWRMRKMLEWFSSSGLSNNVDNGTISK